MRRWYQVRLCYREKCNTDGEIKEAVIKAHSIQDAKIRMRGYWLRTVPDKEYVILAGAKLEEVKENDNQTQEA